MKHITKADDDYTGRTTVPALIDLKTGKVVNNDYHRLTNYFEVDFKPFHKKNASDLYPEELRKDIDEMNDWLFDNINNGVYKTTFCRSKKLTGMHTIPSTQQWICWKKDWRTRDSYSEIM